MLYMFLDSTVFIFYLYLFILSQVQKLTGPGYTEVSNFRKAAEILLSPWNSLSVGNEASAVRKRDFSLGFSAEKDGQTELG